MGLLINPFDLVNMKDVAKRVGRIRKKRPDMSNRQICDIIIEKKTTWCAASGAVTALPGIVPGLGTLVALFGGTLADIAALSYFMAEMVAEMAYLYGRDFGRQGTMKEAVWVLASSVGADAISKNVSKAAMSQLGRQTFSRIVADLLTAMGVRISQRSVVKIIPFLGVFISGYMNYVICRRIGHLVADYYEKNRGDEWNGVTIDV